MSKRVEEHTEYSRVSAVTKTWMYTHRIFWEDFAMANRRPYSAADDGRDVNITTTTTK